jgi:hypothetical protein
MTIAVFLGPTLSVDEARKHLDAVYLPPVRQGDVLRVLASRPSAIGIVDGSFDTVPSVWHKEILTALSRGVYVFGAGSMGALRAAELQQFGMVGIGRIFEAFRDGRLEDDDEVAVIHGPADAGFIQFSDAMVDIRDSLRAAAARGVIAAELAERLITIGKDLYYVHRTYRRIIEDALHAGEDPAALASLEEFLSQHGPSLKQRDAITLLDHLEAFARYQPAPLQVDYHVERTIFLDRLAREVEQAQALGIELGPEDANVPEVVGETLAVLRKKTLLRILARNEAAHIGLEVTAQEVQEVADSFRVDYGLHSADALRAWLADVGLTLSAFSVLMRDVALVQKLEHLYDREIDQGVADQIRLARVRGWSSSESSTNGAAG